MAERSDCGSAPGDAIFEVAHERCYAKVATLGAQILEWKPAGFDPVIYMSRRAQQECQGPVRGGIPICWPWFADHPVNPEMPMHGFVRSRQWNHGFTETNDKEVRMGFWLEDDSSSRESWPHRFRLDVDICFGAELSIRLRMKNTGGTAFAAGGGFHPYIALGSLEATKVLDLAGVPFFDKPTAAERHGEDRSLSIFGELDRIYRHVGPVRIQDGVLGRQLVVSAFGHQRTVVWNPGADEAAKVADMEPRDFQRFVAIEPIIPNEPGLLLSPGDEHVLAMVVSVNKWSVPSSSAAF